MRIRFGCILRADEVSLQGRGLKYTTRSYAKLVSLKTTTMMSWDEEEARARNAKEHVFQLAES